MKPAPFTLAMEHQITQTTVIRDIVSTQYKSDLLSSLNIILNRAMVLLITGILSRMFRLESPMSFV